MTRHLPIKRCLPQELVRTRHGLNINDLAHEAVFFQEFLDQPQLAINKTRHSLQSWQHQKMLLQTFFKQGARGPWHVALWGAGLPTHEALTASWNAELDTCTKKWCLPWMWHWLPNTSNRWLYWKLLQLQVCECVCVPWCYLWLCPESQTASCLKVTLK